LSDDIESHPRSQSAWNVENCSLMMQRHMLGALNAKNLENHSPDDIVSHPRSPECSATLLW